MKNRSSKARAWISVLSAMRIFFQIVVLGVGLLAGLQNARSQAQLDTTRREQGTHSFSAGEFLRNLHASYSVTYMGPYLWSGGPVTYNIYVTDRVSTQLYHSIRLGYQIRDGLQIGIAEDIANNLQSGTNAQGRTYSSSFEQYDPYVYFNLPGLFDFEAWSVFSSASFSLPVSNASKAADRITSLVFSQVWTSKKLPSPWKVGFRHYFNPLFYSGALSPLLQDRQTFYFSFGAFLNYGISQELALALRTHFDVEHRVPTTPGFFSLTRAVPDYVQLGVEYSPKVAPLMLGLSLYLQSLIWSPTLDTSILGGGLSVSI